MPSQRWKALLPYIAALVMSCLLYLLTFQISFTPRPGTLGPAFWPRAAILLIAASALFEILRQLLAGDAGNHIHGVTDELADEMSSGAGLVSAPRSHWIILGAGIVLTILYAMAVPVLGFLLATFILMVVFCYLGGIRSHRAVWGASVLGILAFAFVFLKIAYISLPRGEPPFDQVTQFVMTILSVK